MLLMLLGCGILLKLLGVLALSKEVILGIDLRDGREPDKALVGASSLSSQGLYRKGSPWQTQRGRRALVGVIAWCLSL